MKLIPFFFLALIATGCATASSTPPASSTASVPADAPKGAFHTGQYRNLFVELLGKTPAEADAKIATAFHQLFYGDNDEQRIYYPVGDDLAYIADIGNGDVRSEGISYGLMIAVQLDKKAEFDRLWKWANKYMRHHDGPRAGFFAWQCRFDGSQMDPGSASDGEEWIAMALFFAAHRWGNGGGIFNYEAEAQRVLRDMLHKPDTAVATPIFNRAEKQVVFVPNRSANTFTDPSYHLPFYYELWSRWSDNAEDRKFWAECAATSRAYFHQTAHPVTGLMPEYSHFDGSPYLETRFGPGKGDFRFDARRIIPHIAIDYSWFAADPWQVEHGNRILRFFSTLHPFVPSQMTLDGKPLSDGPSSGLDSVSAVAGLTADPALAKPFVQRLWNMPIPTGKWRYYDGLLYTFALMQCAGKFQIHHPAK